MSETENREGHKIVILVYLAVTAITGIAGFVLGSLGLAAEPVRILGVMTFPPTPFGLAAFGVLTVGTILGVLLLLVIAVSNATGTEKVR